MALRYHERGVTHTLSQAYPTLAHAHAIHPSLMRAMPSLLFSTVSQILLSSSP